jgi:predicted amidohydrolase YtcJ
MVHESRGTFHPPLEELTDLVWQAHSNGFQVAIHAVEEGPVCLALAAIEHALARQPRRDHRHRIEHCSLCPPPFIDTLAATGCTVVTQPGFLYFYGEKYAADVTPDLHNWLYRTRSLLERNIPVAGSSDCPIAPLAPLRGVQTAVTRRARTGLVLNPAEGLALTDAFALFTKAGAWVGFEETKKGRILPGMLADLIVLNEDIVTVPVEEVGALQVATTIIGGIVVWSSL